MTENNLSKMDLLKQDPEKAKLFMSNLQKQAVAETLKQNEVTPFPDLRIATKDTLESLVANIMADIKFTGRPKQQYPEGDWDTWLILAGRGFGKTHVGSHTVNDWAFDNPGCRIAVIVETAKDIERVLIQSNGGIIKQSRPSFVPTFISGAKNYFEYPNGSIAFVYYGTTPESLRGPEHNFAWVDELAKYRYQDEIWEQLNIGLRLGEHPRVLVTTTPRPTKLIKALAADKDTIVTTGSTYENNKLPKATLKKYEKLWKGTRLEAQELNAHILMDNPNSLFSLDNFSLNRIDEDDREAVIERLVKIVIALDPAVTNNENSDSTGIIVAGIDAEGNGYVLEDRTRICTPNEWAKEAIRLYHKYQANYIIGETNMGGDLIETVIRNIDPQISYAGVRATKGKVLRAEPISALYEQNKIHHVGTKMEFLEAQMADFDPTIPVKKSPDRLDAVVWAFAWLMIGKGRMTVGTVNFGN